MKKEYYEYKRILEILNDYWISEPDEEMAVCLMYFKHKNGKEQTKQIVWRNPKFTEKSEGLETIRADELLEIEFPDPFRKFKVGQQQYIKELKDETAKLKFAELMIKLCDYLHDESKTNKEFVDASLKMHKSLGLDKEGNN